MLQLADASERNAEAAVIEGFNSRLTDKIASFECSHPGVRQFLSLPV